jgi:hypothetical protein
MDKVRNVELGFDEDMVDQMAVDFAVGILSPKSPSQMKIGKSRTSDPYFSTPFRDSGYTLEKTKSAIEFYVTFFYYFAVTDEERAIGITGKAETEMTQPRKLVFHWDEMTEHQTI